MGYGAAKGVGAVRNGYEFGGLEAGSYRLKQTGAVAVPGKKTQLGNYEAGSAGNTVAKETAALNRIGQNQRNAVDLSSKPAGSVLNAQSDKRINSVINETNMRKGQITSQHTLTSDEALKAGLSYLGENYKEIGKKGSGVFRSADGTRQFRIDGNSLSGNHDPHVSHMHLERISPNSNKVITNNHIQIKD